jgi:hypothetical protein
LLLATQKAHVLTNAGNMKNATAQYHFSQSDGFAQQPSFSPNGAPQLQPNNSNTA